MIILDTHAWIWWRANPEKLSQAAREAIDAAEDIGIATISCFEVARLVQERRVVLGPDALTWIEEALSDARVRLMQVTPRLAVAAASLDRRRFPGDPADRLIFATALSEGASLVTRDQRIRDYDATITLW